MIALLVSLALAADTSANAQTAQELSYEHLLDCYGPFMMSKGLTKASSRPDLAEWESAARKACAVEIKKHRALVGLEQLERDWKDLWGEWWSRN